MIEDAAGETEVGTREGKAVNATTVKPFFTEKKSFEGKIVTITRKPRPLLSFCRNFCAKLFPRKSHPTVNIEFAIKRVNWVDISKCHTNHFKNHLKHQFLKKRNNISMWKSFSEQYRQEGQIYRYMKSIYSVEKWGPLLPLCSLSDLLRILPTASQGSLLLATRNKKHPKCSVFFWEEGWVGLNRCAISSASQGSLVNSGRFPRLTCRSVLERLTREVNIDFFLFTLLLPPSS